MSSAAGDTRQLERAPPQLGPDRFSPANRRRLSGAGLRTFLLIADQWGLNEDQRRLILGSPARSAFRAWSKRAREHNALTLGVDVLTRISAAIGIFHGLEVLFPDEEERRNWLRSSHIAPVFGGHPPLELITSGRLDDLMTFRRFLEGAKGGLYMPANELDGAFEPYTDDEIAID